MCAQAAGRQVLYTKLYPPRLPPVVARERLHRALEHAESAKLTAIVAGPGHGKSTLAAEFLSRLGRPYIWYRLEDTDADLPVFLSYLAAGLAAVRPGLGASTLARISSASGIGEHGTTALSALITEIDGLAGEEFFIALDDFHTVCESPAVIGAVEFLLGHTMPSVHFIIMSRRQLPLDLADLRARRELLELSEGQLSFDLQETASLFDDVFGTPLAHEELKSVFGYTEGWVSGLILFSLALGLDDGETFGAAIRNREATPAAIYDYLSKAVYENQRDEVREFLVRTSILARMNPGYCDEFLGIDESSLILARLFEERLFTIPMDERGDWYRYHYCLQAFLRQALSWHCSPEQVEELHLRAAGLWKEHGDTEQALSHYVKANCYEDAAEALESIEADLMRASRVSFFHREFSRLPGEVLQKHPGLMLRAGATAAMLGDWKHVFPAVEGAVKGYESAGDREGQAVTLLGAAAACLFTGRRRQAEEMASRANSLMTEDSPLLYEALAIESVMLCDRGRPAEAERAVEKGLRLAGDLEEGRRRVVPLALCGLTLLLQGKLNMAVETLEKADALTPETGLTHAHAYLYAGLSRTCVALDRLEEARQTADRAVALGRKHSLKPMLFLGLAARALSLGYLGEREGALADIAATEELYDGAEAAGEAMWMEWLLAEADLVLGSRAGALRHMKEFDRMAAGYDGCRNIARVGLVACSVDELGPDRAVEEAAGVLDAAKPGGPRLARALAFALMLGLRAAVGPRDEAVCILERYVDEFGPDVVLRWPAPDTADLLPVFTGMFSRGRHLELMDRAYCQEGARSIPYLGRLSRSRNPLVAARARLASEGLSRHVIEPLTVRLLGRFEVCVAGRTLLARDWSSKRALAIFQYLAANGDSGGVSRDVLMDLLWPDTPVESSQKSLNTALTALRKTLEPGAGRGESSYLVAEGDTLSLELGAGGWLDVRLFRDRLEQAARAREAGEFDLYFETLREAADIYRGEFLAEVPYDDWCLARREALLGVYIKLLADIATEHLRRGESRESLDRLGEALLKDPGAEGLYRMKMVAHGMAGDRAGIEEAFRHCESYLRESYDVAPSPETVELYEKLRRA